MPKNNNLNIFYELKKMQTNSHQITEETISVTQHPVCH